MEKTIDMAIAELKQQGKEIYAKLTEAYDKKDWLNFSVLSDQLKFIKEDISKLQQNQTSEISR